MAEKFPLWFNEANGQWVKKHKGKFYYFGPDREAAHTRYCAEMPRIIAGQPRYVDSSDGVTVRYVVNHFLTEKKSDLDGGRLSVSQWNHYIRTTKLIMTTFATEQSVTTLTPSDFSNLMKKLNHYRPHTRAGIVIKVRVVFNHALAFELIDRAVSFGPKFKKPDLVEMRKSKRSKVLTAAEVRKLIDAAEIPMKAMILLGVNCAYGQNDIANLPKSSFSNGWLSFPRVKTAIERRCPLWKETASALKLAIAARPKPIDEANEELAFVNKFGKCYVRHVAGDAGKGTTGSKIDGIGQEYAKLCKRLKIAPGFYRLRHCFRTAADAARDSVATDVIMGHSDGSQGANYRDRVEDKRLQAVVAEVRKWLAL